ncbi:helix-turn-helix transcriptional regulator [Streptomyces sp. NPDC057137]|uniref:helix-turn-helix transcriptional regulator n=1 Tax=Streptomyces sp. NPDC057137 TaxID=3346030 RepID=UPI00362F39FD
MAALAWELLSEQSQGAGMGPRHDLKRRRKALGYSQEEFALAVGVATSTIGRWERGEIAPRDYIRPRLSRLLQVTLAELDTFLTVNRLVYAAGPARRGSHGAAVSYAASDDYLGTGDLDAMIRRDFLRVLTIIGTFLTLPVGNDAVAADHPGEAPATDNLATYGAMNSRLWQLFSLSNSKQAALPLVRDQLNSVAESLNQVRSGRERQQLCSAAGDLFQLAGEVFFDANKYMDAAQCYTLAGSASREARSPDLWACALTRHAFVSIYERRFQDAVPLLTAAARLAEHGDSQLSTRYWVAAVQAEAFAGLGELNACQHALDRAEEVHALTGTVHNGGWLRFDGSRLAEERGTCYVVLGRPDLAERALTNALGQSLSPRRQSGVLTDLAALGVQKRDVDQLLSYASRALNLASQTKSGYMVRKLDGLQGQLSPMRSDKRVSDLSDQISALTSVNWPTS